MQFAGQSSRTSAKSKYGDAPAARTLLSMYKGAVNHEITIGDFEIWALGRLRVLKGIEHVRSRGLKPADASERVKKLIAAHMPNPHVERAGGDRLTYEEWKRRDEVSHHILRLAYCKTQDQRRWFVTHETALFRHRFNNEQSSPAQINAFMAANGLTFTPIPRSEQELLLDDLQTVAEVSAMSLEAKRAAAHTHLTQFFKVAHRQVLVRNGFAYVPRDKLLSIVMGRFRSHLGFCLTRAFKALPAILQDPRFAPRLSNLSKAYVGPGFGPKKGDKASGVTPENVDMHLHQKLKENHHLRHGGRMQYGLFLKGIGLSLEDALRFWQNEFTKSMSAEDFVKRFAYNIRHNYGKEGRRKDYSPYNCTRIIMGAPPGSGDYHGCPFRHWQPHHLQNALSKLQINGVQTAAIMDQVSTKRYQIACRSLFEATHPGADSDDVGNHPNAYFAASSAFYKDTPSATPSTPAAPSPSAAAAAGSGAGTAKPAAAPVAPASSSSFAATSEPVAPAGSPGASKEETS